MARFRLALYLGENGHKLGPGKVRLLEAIREQGSISAAARSMGMAYRHAWLLVDEMNGWFAEPVVVSAIGGREGGGASLTAWGEELVGRFHEMEAATRRAIQEPLAALDDRLARRRAPTRRRRKRRAAD